MITNPILATAAAQPQPSGLPSLIVMGLFFLAFWFLLIAPQRKRQKQQEAMIANLKVGDEVMTTSGIIGTISAIKAEQIVVKTNDSKITFHKSFIQNKLNNK